MGRAAGVDAAWIADKTGIRFRRRAAPDEATSDLAARAAAAFDLNAGGMSTGAPMPRWATPFQAHRPACPQGREWKGSL